MKRKAVVLLSGGEERTDFSPVLGRPLGAYALDAACRVGPEAVLTLPGEGAAARDGWEGIIKRVETKTPVFLLEPARLRVSRGPGVFVALEAARKVLDRYPDCDLLIVPSCLPLLRERTLKSLLRAHAAKGADIG